MVNWFNANLALIVGVVFFLVLVQVGQALFIYFNKSRTHTRLTALCPGLPG